MTDPDTFRRYRRQPTEAGFAAMVRQHVDAVYSAAARQLSSSPDLAKDVTQTVFLELAANARKLPPDVHLGSWLQMVTRRRAIDVIRREATRKKFEAAAAAEVPVQTEESVWAGVRPVLDEALSSLEERDREIIVRRFFESEGYSEIGRALNLSEDAAQKRVTRALQRLRDALSHRGINTAAAALGAMLTSRAVEKAPAGVGSAIIAALPPSLITATAHPVIARLGEKLLFAYLVAGAGALVYLVQLHARQNDEIAQLSRQSAALSAALRQHIRAQPSGSHATAVVVDPSDAEAATLARRIRRMREWLQRTPNEATPQLSLVTYNEWVVIAAQSPGLDLPDSAGAQSRDAVRNAVLALEKIGSQRFMPVLGRALAGFQKATGRLQPDDLQEVLPYFASPVAPAMLDGYSVEPTGLLKCPRFNLAYTYYNDPEQEGIK